jgi:hypothetical protein
MSTEILGFTPTQKEHLREIVSAAVVQAFSISHGVSDGNVESVIRAAVSACPDAFTREQIAYCGFCIGAAIKDMGMV